MTRQSCNYSEEFGPKTSDVKGCVFFELWKNFGNVYCMLSKKKCIINSFVSLTGDECRIIMFKEPIENKAMTGHVIRTEEVPNEGTCRLMCYAEPNCVSINFGPSEGGKHKCELNSVTEEKGLTFVLQDRESYTYLAIEVKHLL